MSMQEITLLEQSLYYVFELRKLQRIYTLNEEYFNKLIEQKAQYSLLKPVMFLKMSSLKIQKFQQFLFHLINS